MTGYLRQRSPGTWEISYELAAAPLTGKRRRANVTVRGTRKEAERELRRLLVAVDTGAHVDPTRITVREWLKTWLAGVRQEVAPRTHERYGELVDNFLTEALGSLPLARLAPIHHQGALYRTRHRRPAGPQSGRTRAANPPAYSPGFERCARPRRRGAALGAQPG
jgi:hypothetical protein